MQSKGKKWGPINLKEKLVVDLAPGRVSLGRWGQGWCVRGLGGSEVGLHTHTASS